MLEKYVSNKLYNKYNPKLIKEIFDRGKLEPSVAVNDETALGIASRLIIREILLGDITKDTLYLYMGIPKNSSLYMFASNVLRKENSYPLSDEVLLTKRQASLNTQSGLFLYYFPEGAEKTMSSFQEQSANNAKKETVYSDVDELGITQGQKDVIKSIYNAGGSLEEALKETHQKEKLLAEKSDKESNKEDKEEDKEQKKDPE